jgi:hypothetical protein
MTLKRPSEYCGDRGALLSPLALLILDASQHRYGCFEGLDTGTLVVGGKTIEFADLHLMEPQPHGGPSQTGNGVCETVIWG